MADIKDFFATEMRDHGVDRVPAAGPHDVEGPTFRAGGALIEGVLRARRLIDLPDAPSSYGGAAGQRLRVNADETGLEWEGMTFTGGGGGGATDPSFADVLLLIAYDGPDASTDFTDLSTRHHTLTAVGDAQVDTAVKQFGTGSCYGTSFGAGHILAAPSADWTLPLEFTIETWINQSIDTNVAVFLSVWDDDGAGAGWVFHLFFDNLRFAFYDTSNTARAVQAAWNPAGNTGYAVAVSRDSFGVVRLFVDGVMIGKATLGQTMRTTTGTLRLRFFPTAVWTLNGWMDNTRITAACRYDDDGGYTPPAEAFPTS